MAPEHNAHFFVYDPAKNWNPGINPENNPYDMGPWSRVAGVPDAEVPGWAIIFQFTLGLDGKIYGGSGYGLDTGHYDYAYLFAYDPSTKTIQSIYHATNQQGIRRLTTGLDGKVYFAVNSADYSHLFVYEPSDKSVADLGEPVAPPDNIGALTTGADGRIYVGTGMAHLVIYDPSTGDFTDLGSIPESEVIWALTTDLFGIIYGGDGLGNFFVYDPAEAWNPGTTSGSNPYNMGQAVLGETRIRSLTTGIDGKIYGGTAWHAHLFVYAPPSLTVSISPMSMAVIVGEPVTFTSTVSGGYTPYTYQWYLNGNPVAGATSEAWTFTPTESGIFYVYLKVTDAKGNTAPSDTARVTVAAVPVGGYSIPINAPTTTTKPITSYIALLTILTAIFTTIKRKTKRKH